MLRPHSRSVKTETLGMIPGWKYFVKAPAGSKVQILSISFKVMCNLIPINLSSQVNIEENISQQNLTS